MQTNMILQQYTCRDEELNEKIRMQINKKFTEHFRQRKKKNKPILFNIPEGDGKNPEKYDNDDMVRIVHIISKVDQTVEEDIFTPNDSIHNERIRPRLIEILL